MQTKNKLREALEQIRDMIMGGGFDGTSPARIVNICDAALAAPATTEKSSAVGNCAKLREAMVEILEYIESFHKYIIPSKRKKLTTLFAVADTIRDKARAALATPLRNCDVGTAEEQAQGFYYFCTEHSSPIRGMCDYKCPCIDSGDKCHCLCKWAQMPYEEGGAS